MADETERNGSKRKRKHSRGLHVEKGKEKKLFQSKRVSKAKEAQKIQPRVPKTATEMSCNWRVLQAVRFNNLLLPMHYVTYVSQASVLMH